MRAYKSKKSVSIPKDTCKFPGCTLSISSGDFCWQHQGSENTIKKTGFKGYLEFYDHVWRNIYPDHTCFITGLNLSYYRNTDLFRNLFAHILRKSAYPKWKHEAKNIRLLSPEIHTLFDNPTLDKVLKWEKRTGYSMEPLFDLESDLHDEYVKEHGSKIFKRKIIELYTNSK